MKNSKEVLKKQIEYIKNLTGLTQAEISLAAGYKENTLTQALAKPDGHEAVLRQLNLIDWKKLKKSTFKTTEENEDVDKDEVIKSQRETISVQKKMIQHLEKIIDELRSDNGHSTNSKAGSFG